MSETKELTRYCIKCGEKLIKKYGGVHYDAVTGEQMWNIYWKCPNSFMLNINGHSKFETDEDGNKIYYPM